MRGIYSLESIRRAERRALSAQDTPDYLMRQAAAHIADAAEQLLTQGATGFAGARTGSAADANLLTRLPRGKEVLLLVGPGGNGGDALYAGALLQQRGYSVAAWLSSTSCHNQALEELQAAGGSVCAEVEPQRPALIIDGIAGLGSGRAIPAELAEFLHNSESCVLAIDIPTGVSYDTGAVPEPIAHRRGSLPAHVIADVTITFQPGGVAHALSPWCGSLLVREVRDSNGMSIGDHLLQDAAPLGTFLPALTQAPPAACEPGPADNKYSGGVVGICAGSAQYPGAALLAAGAAVRATSAMVRFIGSAGVTSQVIAADPEVVAHAGLENVGRCDAWVAGPGWEGQQNVPRSWLDFWSSRSR